MPPSASNTTTTTTTTYHPLSYADLTPKPSPILYDSDSSSDDPPPSKRRRIESIALDYLAGNPIFIFSAALRGPFDKGWVNPWAKRKGHGTGDRQREVVVPATPRGKRDSEGRAALFSRYARGDGRGHKRGGDVPETPAAKSTRRLSRAPASSSRQGHTQVPPPEVVAVPESVREEAGAGAGIAGTRDAPARTTRDLRATSASRARTRPPPATATAPTSYVGTRLLPRVNTVRTSSRASAPPAAEPADRAAAFKRYSSLQPADKFPFFLSKDGACAVKVASKQGSRQGTTADDHDGTQREDGIEGEGEEKEERQSRPPAAPRIQIQIPTQTQTQTPPTKPPTTIPDAAPALTPATAITSAAKPKSRASSTLLNNKSNHLASLRRLTSGKGGDGNGRGSNKGTPSQSQSQSPRKIDKQNKQDNGHKQVPSTAAIAKPGTPVQEEQPPTIIPGSNESSRSLSPSFLSQSVPARAPALDSLRRDQQLIGVQSSPVLLLGTTASDGSWLRKKNGVKVRKQVFTGLPQSPTTEWLASRRRSEEGVGVGMGANGEGAGMGESESPLKRVERLMGGMAAAEGYGEGGLDGLGDARQKEGQGGEAADGVQDSQGDGSAVRSLRDIYNIPPDSDSPEQDRHGSTTKSGTRNNCGNRNITISNHRPKSHPQPTSQQSPIRPSSIASSSSLYLSSDDEVHGIPLYEQGASGTSTANDMLDQELQHAIADAGEYLTEGAFDVEKELRGMRGR